MRACHEHQGLHSPDAGVKFKNYQLAATYAHELLNQSLKLRAATYDARAVATLIPPRLFHYAHVPRDAAHLQHLAAALQDAGPRRQVCGRLPAGGAAVRSSA